MDNLIAPFAASDPMYHTNGSKYSTHDKEMIARGLILIGPAVLGSDPEDVRQFTNLFITDRALIWNNMVAIFQGSDVWTYLKPDKNNRYGRMGYKLICNHYLDPSNIDHMAAGVEKNLAQCI